jgi:hypothetical protein
MRDLSWTNTAYNGTEEAMNTVRKEMPMPNGKTIRTASFGTTFAVLTHATKDEDVLVIPNVSMAVPDSYNTQPIKLSLFLAFADHQPTKGTRKSALRVFSRGFVHSMRGAGRAWMTMAIARDISGTLQKAGKQCSNMLIGSFIGQFGGETGRGRGVQ